MDIEAVGRYPDAVVADVSSSVFSPAEQEALFAARANERAKIFYGIWVRKEALLKAEGCGLGGSLKSFSVARRHLDSVDWLDEVYYPASNCCWGIVDLLPAPDHLGAVALPYGSALCEHMPHEIIS